MPRVLLSGPAVLELWPGIADPLRPATTRGLMRANHALILGVLGR